MGTWMIKVEGHGTHHNEKESDANVIAKEFVTDLQEAGHEITKATFQLTSHDGSTVGEADNLLE